MKRLQHRNSHSPRILWLLILLLVSGAQGLRAQASAPLAVTIQVDASKTEGELKPIWRFFGADEPNYAEMKDGRKLLGELGELKPNEVYFRSHNLLCSGDGTPALKWGSTDIYNEDPTGKPIYNWTIVDRIFDIYLARGVRPYTEIGFMPKALSTHPEPYQHEWRPGLPYNDIVTGWAWPPKDYNKWRELVYQWVKHCVERYGRAEVEKWYWEVWNEANGSYWKASPQDFYKLHDYAIDGVRRALPTARVGGPDTAGSGGKFMDGFLKHVVQETNYATGELGTPTDFLAFHAKGAPLFVDNHVRLGISTHLAEIDRGFAKIAAVPELKHKPIVLGESDPDGCAACQGNQLGYRTGTMYSSYTAALFARKYALADKHGVNLEGAVTWAFEFEDQPYFAGQRVLSNNGVDLAVLNVFRMFSKMSGDRLKTSSSGEVPLDAMLHGGVRTQPDIAALASRNGNRVCVLVWYYHDDDLPGPDANLDIMVNGLPISTGTARISRFVIDQEHSNPYGAWKRMGSPTAPNQKQYHELVESGQLSMADEPAPIAVEQSSVKLKFSISRQAVSLTVLDLAPTQ